MQKLIRQLPTLENLLDILIAVRRTAAAAASVTPCADATQSTAQNCRIEKSFLIDVVSKICEQALCRFAVVVCVRARACRW